MKKKILLGIALITASFLLIGCTSSKNEETEKLNVVVSFNPLKEFAEKIGGDKVKVTSLVPDGMEAHDFEPNPKDLQTLINSKVFIYNGLNMESWLDKVSSAVDETKTMMVDSSKGATVINIEEEDDHGHSHEGDDHNHGGDDPHIWLSLREAKVQAENIKDALVKADSENASYYEQNFESFKNELEALDNEYKEKFATLTKKDFVTGHAAFSYLARDYGLKLKSITNIFNEGEASPKDLESLAKYCKGNGVKVIFTEQTSSSAGATTLANEIKGKTESIYSLETKADNKSYIDGMKYNLEKIYSSLKE